MFGMKSSVLMIFAFLLVGTTAAQPWTSAQLNAANTAKDVAYLTTVEKDAIKYLNLARLYPKQFLALELNGYNGTKKYGDYLKSSPYKKTLQTKLKTLKPAGALVPDKTVYESAKCYAKEMGDAGSVGHNRKKCPALIYAECCSYGMDNGKDIAMQWLIDHDVPGVGHRECCLDANYTKIGLSVHSHKQWDITAVADFE